MPDHLGRRLRLLSDTQPISRALRRSRLAGVFSPAGTTPRSATSKGTCPHSRSWPQSSADLPPIAPSSTSAKSPLASIKPRQSSETIQIAESSVFPQNMRRSSLSRETRCELEKKCTSFPVIAILLLYSTIVCWDFVRSGCRPRGISWVAAVCNRLGVVVRILLVDNHFGSGVRILRGSDLDYRIAWMLLLLVGGPDLLSNARSDSIKLSIPAH